MGTGVGEMMLMSAAMGGGTAALTGGDPLKGALLGGLTGGLGAGISGALGSTGTTAATTAGNVGANAGQAAINSQLTNTLPSAAANAGNVAGSAAGNVGAMTPFTSGAPNIASSGAANLASSAPAVSTAPAAVSTAGTAPSGNMFNLNANAGNFTSNVPRGMQQNLNPMGADVYSVASPNVTLQNLPVKSSVIPGSENIKYATAQPFEANFTGTSGAYNVPGGVSPVDMSKMAYQPNLGGAKAIDSGKGIDALAGGDKFSLKEFFKTSGKGPSLYDDPYEYIKDNKMAAISAALTGSTAKKDLPGEEEYDGPLSRFRFNPATYRPAYFADGGIAMLAAGGYDRQVGEDPYPMRMASGGISDLGSYSDGGRMLRGPGDGMSDSIPASISGKRPARLADGEFVVPADVVSHLGNGSTDAGAKQLYSMMDKVRTARTGKKKQARAVTPQKYMPA